LSLLAEAILLRHEHIVEPDRTDVAGTNAELAANAGGAEAGEAALHDEGSNGAVALLRVERREDEEGIGDGGEGEPSLFAVDPVTARHALRASSDRGGIAAGARLREREGGDPLAARLRRQVARLLLRRGPLEECQAVQREVDREDDAGKGIHALQLLEGN